MSSSSIAAPAPVPPSYTTTQPTPPVVSNDSDDAGEQTATPAPLPPGQGTRIDQLV